MPNRMIRNALTMGSVLAALSGSASAMMPPSVYEDALVAAEGHLQLAITGRKLVSPVHGHGECIVTGIVVHVFRGPQQMGDEISVALPCRHKGSDVPAGGTAFTSVAAIKNAGFLELVLEGSAGNAFEVAAEGMGVAVIAQPSRTPAILTAVGEAGDAAPVASTTGEAAAPPQWDVPCVPGERVEVGTLGYWDTDAIIEAGPDARGRCLVRVGSLTEGLWYTQHQLRRPGSDKPLAEGVLARTDLPSPPEGHYFCYLAGIQPMAELLFTLEGDRYAMAAPALPGAVQFDAATQDLEWDGGPFEGLTAKLQQEVSTGRYTITFARETLGGTRLDYGNTIHCQLQDGL